MNLFISRKLKHDSLFHSFEKEGIDVFGESLIEFTPISFKKPETDWIFFYSKKGVQYYFENCNCNSKQKYAVMGASTGNYFKKHTREAPDYIGNNKGKDIAKELSDLLNGSSITFIKAKKSLDSVEQYLEESDNHYGLVVYNNSIKKGIAIQNLNIPNCDIVVLTSPMNAKAWFEHQPYNKEIVLAIGPTTAAEINSIIEKEVDYCSNPSETELYDLVKQALGSV